MIISSLEIWRITEVDGDIEAAFKEVKGQYDAAEIKPVGIQVVATTNGSELARLLWARGIPVNAVPESGL